MNTRAILMTTAIAVTVALGAGVRSHAAETDGAAKVKSIRLLTLEDAQRIADAAQARAVQDNWNVVIVVADAGGHLIALRRMDGTQVGSIEVAIRKAESSVLFKRPTKALQDLIAVENFTAVLSLKNVTAVEGGVPILHDGQVIGSVGVSGVTAAQDGIIAAAGVEAFR
jgi:glc operon protein GlcG